VAQQKLGLVVLWMTGALLSFSASAVAVRELGKYLSTFEILSIRSGFGLMVLLILIAASRELRKELAFKRMGLHLARNSIHFVGTFLWTLAVTLLPFATVFSLEFTMPAWVALLAVPLLGERMTTSRAGSIVLGFLGVLVIVRPGFSSFQPAALLVLAAALAFSISLIQTKMLTAYVSTFAIIFWMNAMQLPMALAGSDPLFLGKLDAGAILPAITLGAVGLTSHFCLTNAFRAGDATVVVPIDFLRIPVIAAVGWMFYGEGVDIFVFAGASLIIAGVLWNLRAESKRPPTGLGPEKAAIADA
jgi:drug/metabolite transporter (DMT)-like permease